MIEFDYWLNIQPDIKFLIKDEMDQELTQKIQYKIENDSKIYSYHAKLERLFKTELMCLKHAVANTWKE